MCTNRFAAIVAIMAFMAAAPPAVADAGDPAGTTANAGLVVNVKAGPFGAKGDGVSDDTAAIQAAIHHAYGQKKNLAGAAVSVASVPAVYFPAGIYKVSGLNSTAFIRYFSDGKAVIKAGNAGVTLFDNVAYGNDFSGLSFDGGSVQLDIHTGNADSAVINITECTFTSRENRTTSIKTTGSVSSIVNVTGCKFYFQNGGVASGQMILENYCDGFFFTNNWVEGPCTTFFRNYGKLYLNGMIGVPLTGAESWIENRGSLNVQNSRFGGETPSVTIVENHTSGDYTAPLVQTSLVIKNCIISSSAGDYWLKLHAIPNHVEITGNWGFFNSLGIHFGSDIPEADIRNFSLYNDTFNISGNTPDVLARGYFAGGFDNTPAILFGYQSSNAPPSVLPRSSLGFNADLGSGTSGSGTGYTSANVANIFGNICKKITAVSDGSHTLQIPAALSDVPKGMVTVIGDVFVNDDSAVTVRLRGNGQSSYPQILTSGHNILSHTFYNHGGELAIGYSAGFRKGQIFTLGPLRVFAGSANGATINTVTLDSAIPTGNRVGGLAGDRVINSTPAVGKPKSWICIVKGIPGTWVSEGDL